MDYDSDTGFDSQGSSEDEVTEELEKRGIKRRHSDTDSGTSKKSGKKLRKLKKLNQSKKLYKPPTADELNCLRETENLFHSNLFRLQIEEMLKEVQVKSKYKAEFDVWFAKFADWVLKVEDNENKYDISNQEWLQSLNLKIPVAQIPFNVKGTYQFKKPSSVGIIGSYSKNLVIGPKFVVDVLVEMPELFFQKEDYLNTRYHRKRALYICELIHHIQLLPDLVEDINFVSDVVDHMKPTFEIIPFGKFGKYITVMVHFSAAAGTYKLNRFSPSKNNVRRKWFFKENITEQENIPTPFYNSTILSDLVLQQNMNYLKETLLSHNNIKNGIILLKIWLRQRELHKSIGGFNGFIVSCLACYLLKLKKLNLLMSSYQVFRNVCHYLAECDWTTNGITLCTNTEDTNLPSMTEFHGHHKVVFIDVTGYYNLCYAISPSVFKNVQSEAKLAIKWLNDSNMSSFQALFITKLPFYQHHDHVVMFNNAEFLENVVDVHCSKEAKLNQCGVICPLVREAIVDLLQRGFGKRVSQISIKLPEKSHWRINKKPRQLLTLTIGFKLNPESYFSVVDKALETETEAFREFWGTKSELRRFQDGTITEAVVWSGRTLSEKRLICREILCHLLKSKFGLESKDFYYIADQMDGCIAKDVEECSLRAVEAFDELTKQLRNLDNVPLSIVSVHCTSPVFRYTDSFPPVPQKQREAVQQKSKNLRNFGVVNLNLNSCPPWVKPIDVTIQMEASNKWPHDFEAIRRLRAAFNIKISESLTSQHGLISKPFQDRIEVVKNGFVFRIKLTYPNEIVLLKQMTDVDGLVKYKDTEKSLALEKETVYLPKLSSALHGLYQEHNSFGPGCCLVKRWISSHLIDNFHMSEESIELLVASLYLNPEPHEPPQQPQVTLFRFFQLMTVTNWTTDYILLNINGELTQEEIMEVATEFNNNRQTLPAVFIATPYERKKSLWTKDSPTPLILLRLIELCANALRIVESRIYSEALREVEVFFEPCYDSYDIIITLNESFVPKKKATKKFDDFQYPIQKIPINGLDPVFLYVQELRECYDEIALFFYDTYGGSKVAVKWKPNAQEVCDFKIVNLPARIYNPGTKKLELNKKAVLEDFWIFGKTLVERIQAWGFRENFENVNLLPAAKGEDPRPKRVPVHKMMEEMRQETNKRTKQSIK